MGKCRARTLHNLHITHCSTKSLASSNPASRSSSYKIRYAERYWLNPGQIYTQKAYKKCFRDGFDKRHQQHNIPSPTPPNTYGDSPALQTRDDALTFTKINSRNKIKYDANQETYKNTCVYPNAVFLQIHQHKTGWIRRSHMIGSRRRYSIFTITHKIVHPLSILPRT